MAKVVAVTYTGKSDVYNLEVEDTHDFVTAEGVVAHNCGDAIRYLLMERPLGKRPDPPRAPAQPYNPLA